MLNTAELFLAACRAAESVGATELWFGRRSGTVFASVPLEDGAFWLYQWTVEELGEMRRKT
jgi:hypothetical protein